MEATVERIVTSVFGVVMAVVCSCIVVIGLTQLMIAIAERHWAERKNFEVADRNAVSLLLRLAPSPRAVRLPAAGGRKPEKRDAVRASIPSATARSQRCAARRAPSPRARAAVRTWR